MNDLKAAIKCVWVGTVASLIGFFSYLIGRVSEKTFVLAAMEKTILFLATGMILILAISASLHIARAREKMESEVDLRSLPQAKLFTSIVRKIVLAFFLAMVLSTAELLLSKKGDALFVVTIPIMTVILSASAAISFAFYMKRRKLLQWVAEFNSRSMRIEIGR